MREVTVNDSQAWVMFDAGSVQRIFAAHGRKVSEEQAQDILDEINEEICDAMSYAGMQIIDAHYYRLVEGK